MIRFDPYVVASSVWNAEPEHKQYALRYPLSVKCLKL